MIRHSLWLDIERAPDAYTLKKYDSCFTEPTNDETAYPIVLFVGAREKSNILRNILNGDKQMVLGRNSGQVYLWQDRRHRTSYIDFEWNGYLKRKPKTFFDAKGPRSSKLLRCTHGIPKLITSRCFSNLLCSRGIMPLTNVVCYFVSDLGGIEAVAALLADQALRPAS